MKHSGHSPDRISMLVTAFIKMTEAEFTKEVLIPLFENMNYYKVEYHGGRNEGGKDIIAWRTDEIGDVHLTVAQVKKLRLSAKVEDSRSFSGLITQLCQANEKTVPSLDGNEYLPSSIYFITPYAVTARVMTSRFEKYRELRNVRIIDGKRIAELLVKKLPKLASDIIGTSGNLTWVSHKHLSNDILLSALNYNKQRDLKEFYTDIDFTLGRPTTSLFFASEFKGIKQKRLVSFEEWENLKDAHAVALEEIGVSLIISDSIESLTQKLTKLWDGYSRHIQAREELEHQESAVANHIAKTIAAVRSLASLSLFDVNKDDSIFKKKQKDRAWHDFSMRLEKIASCISKSKNLLDASPQDSELLGSDLIRNITARSSELKKQLKSLTSDPQLRDVFLNNNDILGIERLQDVIEEGMSCIDESLAVHKESIGLGCRVQKPQVEIVIDGIELARYLSGKQQSVSKGIATFDEIKSNPDATRTFLSETKHIFDIADRLLSSIHVCSVVGVSAERRLTLDRERYRISCPISHVFKSGSNVAVLGEAGAGKSTSLQMYATRLIEHHHNIVTVYLPLASFVKGWNERVGLNTSDPPDLVEGIVLFLSSFGATITSEELTDILTKERSVILLDGIDEVVRSNRWIIDAMSVFSKRFPRSQIITSSRTAGDYVKNIPFITVTLLPFTSVQRRHFIEGWFGKDRMTEANKVIEHISQTESLNAVTNNPLLITVLCTLAERGVALPDTELQLYEERMRLMLGDYDRKKETDRIRTNRDVLELLARRLAFDLHRDELRENNIDWFIDRAQHHMQRILPFGSAEACVRELIDPCYILVPMNDYGELGFGHLRFQEFLAAKEMNLNRFVQIENYVGNPWWRGTLDLFGQLTDDLWRVIELIGASHVSTEVLEFCRQLIKGRSSDERMHLMYFYKQLIETHAEIRRDIMGQDELKDF